MTILRSMLFAPGNQAKKVEKVFALGADAVILDLEDAVPIAEKEATRMQVKEALNRPRTNLAYVRINPLQTEYFYGDLTHVVCPRLDGVVLAKTESARDVYIADWFLLQLEKEQGMAPGLIDLIPCIETAQGLSNVDEICKASHRVKRISFGAGDFTLDLGATWSKDGTELIFLRSRLTLVSRVTGLEPPIDTVFPDIKDTEGLMREIKLAKQMGFQGKLLIHPNQVAPANEIFSPSPAEISFARKVVEAFAKAEAEGTGSIQVDGQLVDYPVVIKAKRILALIEKISA